ncbi:hypothetical protein SUGI_0655660 [Cryptomeria japonica]|uniref:uncharacterized protein LOC131055015 isoform X2 n=1 Tax=Cryptomeria japonica TaxID=3369 RepID=UPI002414CE7B|nr:uncharacterized protein LOC131055015 isoform X2 [Cryptomeria japonica]GLJ32583.1 hypothetical protein SUGI_0655660 [Cryptomeria japonica]
MADLDTATADSGKEVKVLLKEFDAELSTITNEGEGKESPPLTPFTDAEWLAHLELKFVLRSLKIEMLRTVGRCIGAVYSDGLASHISPTAVNKALMTVQEMTEKIESRAQKRLSITDPGLFPMVLRLVDRYALSMAESDLFQLLFVRGASKSLTFRAIIGGRQDDKEIAMELCGMSFLEVEQFLDDKRTHISEGIIIGQDEYEGKTVRMINEAISALLLGSLNTEQRLKLSKTELLNVMESSKIQDSIPIDTVDYSSQLSLPIIVESNGTPSLTDLNPGIDNSSSRKRRHVSTDQADTSDDLAAETSYTNKLLSQRQISEHQEMEVPVDNENKKIKLCGTDAGTSSETCPSSGPSDEEVKASTNELQPYTSSLEYLDDAFQALALMLRIAKARHKENLKEACNNERPWYDVYRPAKVSSIRELCAKLKYVQNRLHERIKITEQGLKDGSTELPRLEALARKLGLDEFEKGVVVMLTGIAISPVVKSIFEGDNGDSSFRRCGEVVQVKDILTVFFDSFKEQVLARTHFYKSSKLVARGLIKLRVVAYARGGGDLMDQQVELDRRMLDWIVGLDTEMNELVEGSHLYKPMVPIESVVLPDEQKKTILRTTDNFAKFRQYRKNAGLEDFMTYGAGLVILLCGPSGTGKTMTVNAVAHHLGKRVLLVDFHSLQSVCGGNSRDDHSADLRGLFRDADMNDAIIFFDECEAIFAQRERGGDKLLNTLLTEMERYEGIIMLATNRPLDLDEAMHRRITCVSEFHQPDHTQRYKIWKLASERLPVAENIDWEKISLRYELSGGYIKNALLSSLLLAISRDSHNPKMTEEDIISGCRSQMRGSLQMKSFTHRVVPKTSMDELILSTSMRKHLECIISFEKARAVLLGQWGFQQEQLGTACFFWGAHGTGKSAAAEAIGFELGRPLKVINCAQLVSNEQSSKTSSNICTSFKDARLLDAVLVLEDFQIFGSENASSRDGITSVSPWSDVAIGLLLHELERFPGICILVANFIQESAIHRLDPELRRRLKFIVEFKMPDQAVRTQMWKKMIPNKAPVATDIDFEELGRRFEFASGTINAAIIRAAAEAALRYKESHRITMKDLVKAAETELEHMKDEISETMLRAFL